MECLEDPQARIDTFRREIELRGNLDEAQRARLMEIAEKCPVHRTLGSPTQILSTESSRES
jgi:putative redox protein